MNAAEREQLWTEFFKRPTPELREQIIVEYAPLVKIVAGRLPLASITGSMPCSTYSFKEIILVTLS